jgi:hypothetical protein
VVKLIGDPELLPLHEAQVINYMNLLKIPTGILLNFYVDDFPKQGQKSFVNQYYDSLR